MFGLTLGLYRPIVVAGCGDARQFVGHGLVLEAEGCKKWRGIGCRGSGGTPNDNYAKTVEERQD